MKLCNGNRVIIDIRDMAQGESLVAGKSVKGDGITDDTTAHPQAKQRQKKNER